MERNIWQVNGGCRKIKNNLTKITQKLLRSSQAQSNYEPRQSGKKVALREKHITEKIVRRRKEAKLIKQSQTKVTPTAISRTDITKKIRPRQYYITVCC